MTKSTAARAKPWALINLPPFPAVATRIMQLVSQDRSGLKELADVIRADVAFSAEILALANCPLFAIRTEINSVLQATVLLGLNRVKGIAMTVGLRAYLTDSVKMPVMLACWRHSLAVAILSEELASAAFMEREAAYMAGLLHDIGRLALGMIEPVKYSNLIAEMEASGGDVRAREKDLFGLDHCEAGRWMANQWKLPKHLAEVAFRHHDLPPEKFDVVSLVHYGCMLAESIGFGAVQLPNAPQFDQVVRMLPSAVAGGLKHSREEMTLRVATKINSMDAGFPVA